jgi:hypothetical protein
VNVRVELTEYIILKSDATDILDNFDAEDISFGVVIYFIDNGMNEFEQIRPEGRPEIYEVSIRHNDAFEIAS